MLRVNNKLWLISDTHFGHKNIIKFQQRPESHEVIMLSEWIWRVGETDQILHMGDVFMGKQGSPDRWAAVVARLPGEKFLLKGNHDKHPDTFYENCGFTIVEPFIVQGYAFTHRPITDEHPFPGDDLWHTNIHGHTHGNLFPNPVYEGNLYDKKYINVCVENTQLRPRQLGGIWHRS